MSHKLNTTKIKTAIITGITGMDGSYLAEFLLGKGYRVIGITDGADPKKMKNIKDLKIELFYADVRDGIAISEAIKYYKPNEYYNLAAQSFVGSSWDLEYKTYSTNLFGATNALDAIHIFAPDCHFYQASTSEMFGNIQETPQNEMTKFYPRSPYGISKLAAHWATINYRESYNLFACSGILFNHESPRRHEQFVTRKITKAVAAIKQGKQKKLYLGNLDVKRDWGWSPDYVKAMWIMLQQTEPDDYVIATGESHTVREFCDIAFSCLGLDYRKYVEIDKEFYRPAEIQILTGDATKAKQKLKWQPTISFKELVERMVKNDLK